MSNDQTHSVHSQLFNIQQRFEYNPQICVLKLNWQLEVFSSALFRMSKKTWNHLSLCNFICVQECQRAKWVDITAAWRSLQSADQYRGGQNNRNTVFTVWTRRSILRPQKVCKDQKLQRRESLLVPEGDLFYRGKHLSDLNKTNIL